MLPNPSISLRVPVCALILEILISEAVGVSVVAWDRALAPALYLCHLARPSRLAGCRLCAEIWESRKTLDQHE